MPYKRKAKLARQATSTRPAVLMITPLSPQAAMDTMMALYSYARRQLDAVELFLSSFEDKVQYLTDYSYGAWLGAEWRIQLATLADTLRAKIERVYLPTLSAVAAYPKCSPETRNCVSSLKHRADGALRALEDLSRTLAGVPTTRASKRDEMAALRAAELVCRTVVVEFEDAMFALDEDEAAKWTMHCKMRPATMVPNSSKYG